MNIYVGNLPYNLTEDELHDAFAAHGTVTSSVIITDRDTGRSRGFGFVEMETDDEANAAIAALNGSDLGGRTLTVNEARPRQDRGGGGGGGRGRSGGGGGRGRRDFR
jgi:RNA recognition motif-containing protein